MAWILMIWVVTLWVNVIESGENSKSLLRPSYFFCTWQQHWIFYACTPTPGLRQSCGICGASQILAVSSLLCRYTPAAGKLHPRSTSAVLGERQGSGLECLSVVWTEREDDITSKDLLVWAL